ncbi:MAG: YqeG family HAD IIIA-type phosphatase [Clostridia bacterium]|nr:YqeG family HAD IIIA-type phosphatase [Clostridia bacterium]
MSIFSPTMMKNRITDITVEDLKSLGIKGILLDVDNTLTKFHSQVLTKEVEQWLQTIANAGFKLTVVSNGLPKRVRPFTKKIGLESVSFSCKPSPLGFWRGAKRLGCSLKEVVAIGDQIFTDVVGAHIARVKVIQVMPIELETNRPSIMFKRKLEKRFNRRYIKKHGVEL